nr:hypothetical protein [Pseudopedobacter sp.]
MWCDNGSASNAIFAQIRQTLAVIVATVLTEDAHNKTKLNRPVNHPSKEDCNKILKKFA